MDLQNLSMPENVDMAGVKRMSLTAAATLKIRGGVRSGLIRQESRKGCVDTMGDERDIGREPRSDAYCLVYESHGQDCRYKPLGDTCSTISQKYGTGGGQRADSGEV